MRITFLIMASDMTGGARVIHIYATRLQAWGHQVTIVTRPPKRMTLLAATLDHIRPILGKRRKAPIDHGTHYRNETYTLKEIDKYRPISGDDVPDGDVVIATWWETVEWMLDMPAKKGRHVHFIQHYEAFDNMPKERVDAALSGPPFKITISKWLDDLIRNRLGKDNVVKIPNSVDMEQFNAPPRGRRAQPTVGMLYSVVDWKDCRTGFKAFELLKEKLPDARLVTFGSSASLAELPLPPGTSHTILPDQDKIRDIYAQCDVWFCPSQYEGFHLPPLEAMACRCPVISTEIGGPLDTIIEGVNGFFVPIGDAAQMAATLERFFALSPEQWQAMSDAAYATATGYSWDDAAKLFEEALEEVMATGA